ncbi:MAG: efflux transporter outer membrane subunit [Myxococcales bacterium]|nr:efflux transporter outer membrane subunit [Myxococcales bacterium]
MRRGAGPTARRAPVLALLLASACNVGPRYRRPAAPQAGVFKEAAPAAYEGSPAGTWRPAEPQDGARKGRWWEIFGEPELDALEERLDAGNQPIAQSFHNFMAARAQVDVARAGYFPTLSADATATRGTSGARAAYVGTSAGSTTGTTAGTPPLGAMGSAAGAATSPAAGTVSNVNYFSLAADASWAPDLWGRVQSAVRQAQYAAQVSAADLENTRLTEQAALAQYFFQLRGQDSLVELYARTVRADVETLEITRARSQTGIDSEQAVAQAELTLANAQASAAGVAVNRAIYEHAIATLLGRPPSSLSMPVRPLTASPPAIPVALPSTLLERRPDVAAAERTLAEANALIGVATAALYPSLNLSASAGVASTALDTLFAVPALFWSLGAMASQTLFDGGLRRATIAQYRATYEADVAAYRQTVLTAFQQVEDGVASLRTLSGQIARQELAVRAAQRNLDIALAGYETGIVPYLNVITAQTALLGDEQMLLTLRVSVMTAAVQLVQALGGGWDLSKLPSVDQITSDEGLRKVSGP